MNIYEQRVEDLPGKWKNLTTVVPDVDSLNRRIASEFGDLLEEKSRKKELLTIIAPVGPLDYGYFAREAINRNLDCRFLRCINMDEYLDEKDTWISTDHPLGFRRFMEETFFSHLPEDKRPLPENIIFPDPVNPERVTGLIDEIGGADICWGGFGITGHLAFNDPPEMLGEPTDLESFKNSKCRKLTVSPMATGQMAMGGTDGNLDIIPTRAVTLGMYELLKSKKLHLTFMRKWHAGLWRKAILEPVTSSFPGSLVQLHNNVEITMTELAAQIPRVNTSQETGEK